MLRITLILYMPRICMYMFPVVSCQMFTQDRHDLRWRLHEHEACSSRPLQLESEIESASREKLCACEHVIQ